MNSLSFYKKNILFYDLINKFNHSDVNRIMQVQKLVVSTKLTVVNVKFLLTNLLALEIITFKKSFFDSKFYLTVKNGNYFFIKIELRNTNIDLFFLKYMWLYFPKLIKYNNSLYNKKKSKKKKVEKSLLHFKINFIKELEYFINFKHSNTIHLNLLLSNRSSVNSSFFFKSCKISL